MYGSLYQLLLPSRVETDEGMESPLVLRESVACLRLLAGVLVARLATGSEPIDVLHGEALTRGVSSRLSILAVKPTWRLQDFLSGESLLCGIISSTSDFEAALTSASCVGD